MFDLNHVETFENEKENGENIANLEITEVVLADLYVINNDYQQDSRVMYTFVHDKSFGQLLDISPQNFIFLKTFNSEFLYIEVRFTDQNSKPLDIEDDIFRYEEKWLYIQFNVDIKYL